MSLDNVTCDVCGMRFADTVLYHEHLAGAHPGRESIDAGHEAQGERETQEQEEGMPSGSLVREDRPPSPGEREGATTSE